MLPDKLPYILPFPHWVLVPAPIHADGDVVVIHDLVGAFPWFIPAFVKPRADVAGSMTAAVKEWMEDRYTDPGSISS